ncbi:MAG TPA: PQQ-dependent sugar dehydrogenase [Thermoplasmata archaeon]|nr:PQQ-dependent sugar dehydrogenase [Thermoplasmata archaeon]
MASRNRVFLLAIVVAALIVLAGLTYVMWQSLHPPGGGGNGVNPPVQLAPVQTGLAWPVALAFAPDGRVFFAERLSGDIRILKNGAVLPTPFYSLANTDGSGERGLLGLALDPAFPSSPWVYAYQTYDDVTNATVYNRIVRIQASGDLGLSHSVILQLPPLSGATNHNGGVIAFGPDGKLYAVVGENADPALSQDPMTPMGKVLRMNSDGTAPPDNPFFGSLSWDNLVFTYGHRNMFGIAFHPVTHRVYVTENGPNCNDEINLLTAAANYGWGPNATCSTPPQPPANTNRDGANPVMPIWWWGPTICPTNAAFFTGPLLPQSQNHLLVGACNDNRLRDLTLSADGASVVNESTVLTAPAPILDVEMGLDRSLWITTPSAIYRLVAAPTIMGGFAMAPLVVVTVMAAIAGPAVRETPSNVRPASRVRNSSRKP